MGDKVKIFDGGAGTARETKRLILLNNMSNTSRKKGTVKFINSLDTEEETALCKKLFEMKTGD
jgi:glutamate racemase